LANLTPVLIFSDEIIIDYVDAGTPAFNYKASAGLMNIGVFAQLRAEPSNRMRLSSGVGVDFQDFIGVDGSEQSTSAVAYNLSGEYDVTDRFVVSAGYSNIWGGIGLAENYILNPGWDYAAAEIEDVTAENFYVAVRYEFDWATVDGKVFSTQINNARAVNYRNGPAVSSDVEAKGFELGLSTNWESGFARIGYSNVETQVNDLSIHSFTGNYLTMPLGETVTFQTAHQFNNGVIIGGDGKEGCVSGHTKGVGVEAI
jgi:hemoglobin/transferrin/lactoferrin receptor protein